MYTQIHARLVEAALPSNSTPTAAEDFQSRAPFIILPNAQSLKCGLFIPDLMEVKSELLCWIQEHHDQQLQEMLYGRDRRADETGVGDLSHILEEDSDLHMTTHKQYSHHNETAMPLRITKPVHGVTADKVLPLPVVRLRGLLSRLREHQERSASQLVQEQPEVRGNSSQPPQHQERSASQLVQEQPEARGTSSQPPQHQVRERAAVVSATNTTAYIDPAAVRSGERGLPIPGYDERLADIVANMAGPSAFILSEASQQLDAGISRGTAAVRTANVVMELMHQLYKPTSLAVPDRVQMLRFRPGEVLTCNFRVIIKPC
jgi:hypothetical protein